MELKVNQDNCLGCGICVIACPVNAAISPENAGGNGAITVKRTEIDHTPISSTTWKEALDAIKD